MLSLYKNELSLSIDGERDQNGPGTVGGHGAERHSSSSAARVLRGQWNPAGGLLSCRHGAAGLLVSRLGLSAARAPGWPEALQASGGGAGDVSRRPRGGATARSDM